MRIGIISSGTPTDRIPPVYGGGIQKYVWNLAKELNKRGHQIHIFTHQKPSQSKEEVRNGINIHRISHHLKKSPFSTMIFGFKVVFRMLGIQKRTGRFQIVHAQSRVSAIIAQLLFPFKIPFIFTAHNWDVALTIPGNFIPLFTYYLLFCIEKNVYKKSDMIVTLTKSFQKILVHRYKIPLDKIQTIPNMTGMTEQSEKKVSLSPLIESIEAEPYILYIGRLESEKGLGFLLDNFRQIQKDENYLNLVIVGGGSLKKTLIKKINTFDIKDKIHILGVIHENQLKRLLSKAQALILPSKFEIMPTVVLESWAVGCPVIVRNYHGIKELIQHNITGMIFNNSKALVECVQELLSNNKLRQALKKNAQMQLYSSYIAPRVTEQLITLYHRLLKR